MTIGASTRVSATPRWWPWGAGGALVAGQVLAFPPFGGPGVWLVLVFLVPFILWAARAPRWKPYLGTVLLASWLAWFFTLIWLRHIYPPWGWVGLAFLAAEAAIFPVTWLLALRWAAPRMAHPAAAGRLLGALGLAGLWVVLDWVRSWLFSGFLWLPLSAAWWEHPWLLQMASWTGQGGVTFIIVALNLSPALLGLGRFRADAATLAERWDLRAMPLFTPVIFVFLLCALFFQLPSGGPKENGEKLTAALVQPDTPPLLKWDDAHRVENWTTLRDLTLPFKDGAADLVLWPEAAPPFSAAGPGTEDGQSLLRRLVDELGRPLLFGATARAAPPPGSDAPDGGYYNALLVMNPGTGLAPGFYAKIQRVPFGEYTPGWVPFAAQVVPLAGNLRRGEWQQPLPVRTRAGATLQAGPLICYEDIFPALARAQARAGADFLVVVTNDGWYGTEGGAYQHAAHAVLRAIETRRPVLRCGNAGWSGVIDEYGAARALVLRDGKVEAGPPGGGEGTIYFRGAGAVEMFLDPAWRGRESFYVRHGEWFTAVCAALALAGAVVLRRVAPN